MLLEYLFGVCCVIGEVVIILGFVLVVWYIIYIVGFVWCGGECGEVELFGCCYWCLFVLVVEY